MCPNSGFQEKIDVLDLIINILKEHEENLMSLADKFESVLRNLNEVESKILRLNDTFAQVVFSASWDSKEMKKPITLTQCEEWTEFQARSAGAQTVAFEVEEKLFTVNSLLGDVVYRYSEFLPELKLHVEEGEKRYVVKKVAFDSDGDMFPVFEGRLRCGLCLFVQGSRVDLSNTERLFQVTYYVDPAKTRAWLSTALGVSEDRIIEGKLACSVR